ncbi:MAG: PD40 domain-containing protein [Planctomycetes bacterium]|nr:PD40 domain-containing protein [Planctomycetota bacterium]
MIRIILAILAQTPIQPEKLPLPDGVRHGATFSPDGAWIYWFEDVPRTDKFGRFARNVALFRATPDAKKTEKILDVGDTVGEVHWTPDGKRMVLVRHADDTNGDGKIDHKDGDALWMGDPDGKNESLLVPASLKKLSFYGFLADGKIVIGVRDDAEGDARVVVRDAAGKEEDLCRAAGYLFSHEAEDWIKVMEKPAGDDFMRPEPEPKYFRFSFPKKQLLEALEVQHVVGWPRSAAGKLWYARRVDSNKDSKFDGKDNTVLVVASEKGEKPRDLTKGEEQIFPARWLGGGMLCLVTRADATDFVQIAPGGKRTPLWTVKGAASRPRFSDDGRKVAFTVARDSTADGKIRSWEDASDIFVAELPAAFAPPTEAELKKGQEYLDKVAKAWAAKPPGEMLLGMYLGNAWFGSWDIAIKPTADGFEVSVHVEVRVGDRPPDTVQVTLVLDRSLRLVRLHEEESGPEDRKVATTTVTAGRWHRRVDRQGKITESSGPCVLGGRVFQPLLFLPLAPLPEGVVILESDVSDMGGEIGRRAPGMTKRTIGGRDVECNVVEIRSRWKGDRSRWYFDSQGRPLSCILGDQGSGLRFHLRPIQKADIGKPLAEPLQLKEWEKVCIECLVAEIRHDSKAYLACVDLEKYARTTVPDFDKLTEAQRTHKLEEIRAIFEQLVERRDPKELPKMDGVTVESVYGPSLESTVKDGVATVRLPGAWVYKLSLATEGDRKGKWLIFDMQEDDEF